MKISSYNLIVFILEYSYENYQLRENPDWHDWFYSILRIYRRNIPIKLLLGLKKKNNTIINVLCDEEFEKIEVRKKKENEKKEKKRIEYDNWVQKCDAGNRFAEEKKQQRLKNKLAEMREIEKRKQETYREQMQSIWKTKYENLIVEREKQDTDLWAHLP